MKRFLQFNLILLLVLFFYGCCHQKVCEAFDERKIFFVPFHLEINDSLIFYNQEGDSIVYTVLTKNPTPEEEYSSCDDSDCTPYFSMNMINLKSIEKHNIYCSLYYMPNHNSNLIYTYYSINKEYFYDDRFDFEYIIQDRQLIETNPYTLIENIEINGIIYQDIIILNDRNQKIEVYISKEYGIVQIIEKETDKKWTLKNY